MESFNINCQLICNTQNETHLCRSFDVTVHEKALDGVGLGHHRFLHVLLGIWAFRTFSCKHFMQDISLLKLNVHKMKRQHCRTTSFSATTYLCCSQQHRPLNRHQRFLSRPRRIPFHLGDKEPITPLCHSNTLVKMEPGRWLTIINDPVVLLSVLHHL